LTGACVLIGVALLAQVQPERVVTEWDFAGHADMCGWVRGGDVLSCEPSDEGIALVTGPSDPQIFGPEVVIPTSPLQAVEIAYRSDAGGPGELFWAHDRSGRFQGFGQEKSAVLPFEPTAEWKTLRCRPFWQDGTQVIQLRIDPPSGCATTIRSVRVLEPELPVGETWDGSPEEATDELSLLQDAQVTEDGVKLGPEGLAVSRPMTALTAEQAWVGLESPASADEARVRIGFAYDGVGGVTWTTADLAPGRVANVMIPPAEGALGRTGYLLLMSEGVPEGGEASGSPIVSRVAVGTEPTGPPAPRIVWFGSADPIARTGREERIMLRLANPSSPIARGLEAWLELPAGVTLLSDSPRTDGVITLDTGDVNDITWSVRVDRAGTFPLGVRLLGGGVDIHRLAAVAFSDPPQGLAPGVVPEPKRPKADIDIGIYHFPGWNTRSAWEVLDLFPERTPMLGYYQEGTAEAVDWQILWAAERGVRFFAYDWYWCQGAQMLDHEINAYLKCRNRRYLDFCLLWANHNPPGTSSRDDLLAVTQFWIDRYFREPEYYKIDGRPLVIVFSPDRLSDDMGEGAVAAAFKEMRALCESQGVPPVYLAACSGPEKGRAERLARMGYDALTAYTWPGLGCGNKRVASCDEVIDGYKQAWESIAEDGALPMITPVFGGWDPRPWHGDLSIYRTGRTPDLFERHLRDAKEFIDKGRGIAGPVAIVEAWNEWGEGSYVAPHRQWGFGYLDAIARVFAGVRKPVPAVLPKDVGLGPYEIPEPSYAAAWEMNGPDEGWVPGGGTIDPQWTSGVLSFRTSGGDPVISGPATRMVARDYSRLLVRMSSDKEGVAQLFWATKTLTMSERTSARLPIVGDGVMRDYVISLEDKPAWTGIVTRLRFDPISSGEASISIDRMEFLQR